MFISDFTLQYMNIKINVVLALIFLIPCLFDGILQYYFQQESTNSRRIITGFLAGFGLAALLSFI